MSSDPDLSVAPPSHSELGELVELMRAYCDFYGVDPREERLVALSRALLEDPGEGVQLLARDGDQRAIGFATVFWSWSTLVAERIGVMNDLFVVEPARGRGVGRALIEGCRARCRSHGANKLVWSTAPDNLPAQRLYDATGAEATTWVEYELDAW